MTGDAKIQQKGRSCLLSGQINRRFPVHHFHPLSCFPIIDMIPVAVRMPRTMLLPNRWVLLPGDQSMFITSVQLQICCTGQDPLKLWNYSSTVL
jgi:hypothetical protein